MGTLQMPVSNGGKGMAPELVLAWPLAEKRLRARAGSHKRSVGGNLKRGKARSLLAAPFVPTVHLLIVYWLVYNRSAHWSKVLRCDNAV